MLIIKTLIEMIELREYQESTIIALRDSMKDGNSRLILTAPTGAGKTVMFSYMIKSAISRGKKALILTHRSELLTQAGGSLSRLGLTPQDINPKLKTLDKSAPLSVAMAQTLKRRLDKPEYIDWLSHLDIVVVDEAHTQDSDKILQSLTDKTFIIGVTATPYREHNSTQLKTIYSAIIDQIKISYLINSGFLAQPRYFGIPATLDGIKKKGGDYDNEQMGKVFTEQRLYEGVLHNYTEKCAGKKAIIFAPSVEASLRLTAEFKIAGLPIVHIDANTTEIDRKAALKWFKETPGALISNVGILNAGFDEPSIEVVILYRATKSLPLYLQMCGRGSRTTDTKSEFLILDFGNNILEHGYWHDERHWKLETKKRITKGIAPERECPECTAHIPVHLKICPYCQAELPAKEKTEDEQFVELIELLSYAELQQMSQNATFKKLRLIAKTKGYKDGWILNQLNSDDAIREYGKYMGYHKKWAEFRIQLKNKKS